MALEQLPDFEVTAKSDAETQTIGPYTKLTTELLGSPGTSLASVISTAAGVQVLESGGTGGFSSVMLRGADSEQVLIFLDGFLLNTSSGGGVDLSTIDLLHANEVEIFRGATPGEFTQASLGGAVNIRTGSIEKNGSIALSSGYGSFGGNSLGLAIRQKIHSAEISTSLSSVGSQNDYPFTNDNGTQFNPNDDFRDHRTNADITQHSALLKLKQQPSNAKLSSRLMLHALDKSQGLPDRKNSLENATRLDTEHYNGQVAFTFKPSEGKTLEYDAGFFFRLEKEQFRGLSSSISLRPQHSAATTDIAGISTHTQLSKKKSSLRYSLELRDETLRNQDLITNTQDTTANRQQLDGALQHTQNLLKEKMTLTPLLRYQWQENQFKVAQGFNTDDQHPQASSYSVLTPQLGIHYQFSPGLEFMVNTGRYFRAPSFFELFGNRGFFLGNSQLEPERGISSDIALVSNIKMDTSRTIDTSLSFFHRKLDQAISRNYGSNGLGKAINIPGAVIYGSELSVNIYRGKAWSATGNVTWQETTNHDPRPGFTGKQLPGRATQTVNVLAQKTWRNQLRLDYNFAMKLNRFYDTANLLPAKDESLHNLSLSFDRAAWRMALSVRNLTNEQNEDFNGYPKPGRSYHFKVTWKGETQQ
ncbi:MAG: TonB-dependent receptor [Thiotrichales bacterium]